MTKTTTHRIHVNTYGEFDRGCMCGASDFYTVVKRNGTWHEIEPVIQWDGWACANCNRVWTDAGRLITKPNTIEWM